MLSHLPFLGRLARLRNTALPVVQRGRRQDDKGRPYALARRKDVPSNSVAQDTDC